MNRTTFALFVAILIHLVFLLLVFLVFGTISPNIQKQKKEEQKIKISLKERPKLKKDSGLIKKKIKRTDIAPPMPKGSQLKKIIKSNQAKSVKFEPKKTLKIPTLNKQVKKSKPNIKKVQKTKPLPSAKSYIPVSKKDPMAWMYEDKSEKEEPEKKKVVTSNAQAGGTTAQMKKLYGEKWGQLTPGQQKYMLDNQEIMRRITQKILTRVANVNLTNNMNVNKMNIIEFYLHPNGNMTDFRFLSKSGYYILDDTTRETIEYAYSKYPRPKEKILVRYNVYYHLAKY